MRKESKGTRSLLKPHSIYEDIAELYGNCKLNNSFILLLKAGRIRLGMN